MSEQALQSRPVVVDATVAAHIANRVYGETYGIDWIWHHDGIGFLYPSTKPLGAIADISEICGDTK